MKRLAPAVVLFLFAIVAWNMFSRSHGFDADFVDGDAFGDFHGPVGAVIGLLFAGGGLVIGAIVALCVGAVLAVVFAGVGVLLMTLFALAALVLAAVLAPLLLPVLLPLALIWWLVSRRKHKAAPAAVV